MSEQLKRHPLAIAWDEWLVSKEGDECRQANTLAHNTNIYLENRLHRAFDAGANTRSFPSEADKKLLNKLYDDLIANGWSVQYLEPLKALIERIGS